MLGASATATAHKTYARMHPTARFTYQFIWWNHVDEIPIRSCKVARLGVDTQRPVPPLTNKRKRVRNCVHTGVHDVHEHTKRFTMPDSIGTSSGNALSITQFMAPVAKMRIRSSSSDR